MTAPMLAEPTVTTGTATSADGTTIAYECLGAGPALVLVDGALCYRASGPMRAFAKQLRLDFTVYTYDRRGRGESGNTAPYAIEREVEDLAAVIAAAGGEAMVYGTSSGAALALEAANAGVPITRLALYEAPFIVDDTRTPVDDAYVAQMSELAAADPGGAVKHFMRNGVQVPAVFVAMMRVMPAWSKLRAIASTLPYDTALTAPFQRGVALPRDRWTNVTMPTVVIAGGKSPAWMRNAQADLAAAIGAEHFVLEGQTHMVKPAALVPVLTSFFSP